MKRRLLAQILVSAGLIAIACFTVDSRIVRISEKFLDDNWFRLAPEQKTEDRIAVIEIDDRTLEFYFPEIPLPRDQIALLLAGLIEEPIKAKAVAIDLYFEGPDRVDAGNDTLLAFIIGQHADRVICAASFSELLAEAQTTQAVGAHRLEPYSYPEPDFKAPVANRVNVPPGIVMEAIRNYGHIDIYRDETSVPRELPIVIQYEGSNIAALSLEVLRRYMDIAREDVSFTRESVQVGHRIIPVDQYGSLSLRYFDNAAGYIQHSMIDVLASVEEDPASLAHLRDKIVLVGINSKTYYPKEISYTPAGVERPNVYLHADVISNMLTGLYFHTLSFMKVFLLLLIVAVAFFIIRASKNRSMRLLFSLAIVFGVLCVDFFLYQSGIKFPSVTFLVLSIPLTVYTYFGSFQEQVEIIRIQEKEKLELRKKEASLEEIQREIRVARAIQEHLLPKTMPDISGFDVFGLNVAAKGVSGDFFDFVKLSDERWGIAVADVSGKGISAALLMAATQSVLRTECQRADAAELTCAEIIGECNQSVVAITDPARFVTMFHCILDKRASELSYVNAGHNGPLLLHTDGEVELLESSDIILGVLPEYIYTTRTIDLSDFRKLVIYSDGVVEASNGDDEMYGEERLLAFVSTHREMSAEDLARGLVKDVSDYSADAGQSDDITVVVLGRCRVQP